MPATDTTDFEGECGLANRCIIGPPCLKFADHSVERFDCADPCQFSILEEHRALNCLGPDTADELMFTAKRAAEHQFAPVAWCDATQQAYDGVATGESEEPRVRRFVTGEIRELEGERRRTGRGLLVPRELDGVIAGNRQNDVFATELRIDNLAVRLGNLNRAIVLVFVTSPETYGASDR